MQQLTIPAAVTHHITPGWAQPAERSTDACAAMLERMLDIVDYGMLLLLPNGQVIYANATARFDLEDHPLMQLQGQVLQVGQPRDATALREALVGAVQRGCQKLLTLGGECEATLNVAVVPVLESNAGRAAGAMLVLGKRRIYDEMSIESFARHHRLTPAEQRVLKLLCAGRRPTEIAQILQVCLSTVRTQIASILEKTGLSGIGALIREVSRLPPLRKLLRAA
ncbi:MAG: helix-turn-helix transcriptional regulator [Burkholderiales bacterium]|nr:helix-turn-helix transcriptional regulator [Burkholderiales bacterium]